MPRYRMTLKVLEAEVSKAADILRLWNREKSRIAQQGDSAFLVYGGMDAVPAGWICCGGYIPTVKNIDGEKKVLRGS